MTDTLIAGRELDALIAKSVVGDHYYDPPCLVGYREFRWKHRDELMEDPPYYSTDIASAYEVVEALREKGWMLTLTDIPGESSVRAMATFGLTPLLSPAYREHVAVAETPSLAICLAAVGASA